jgi:glycosyltransferase involved in cell wall biosynthesis
MKILHIIPGSGGSFYCGNCMRDSKYVPALKALGHDVVKLPMYLPLFANVEEENDTPVFYGAVSIYLKQLYPVFRKAPKWVDALLNAKPLLKLAAKYSGSTDAKGLEDMTISMLMGEEGQQSEELERMVDWIVDHYKPDVIHLSNALLLGLAPTIKRRLNTVLICSLQDEDVWVDVMDPQFRDRVWSLMEKAVEHVDGFVAVSDYYAARMKESMKIPAEKLTSIHIGVDPADYFPYPIENKKRTIGYVSRMCHDNGLDILVDAFIGLKKRTGFEDVTLMITGGSTAVDSKYLNNLKTLIKKNNLTGQVHFHEDFSTAGLKDFYEKIMVLSVPVRNGEAFGIYLLESMASGVPVIQPALGAFPEIINLSGGGVVYQPNEPSALTRALADTLSNPALLSKLSLAAIKGVETSFDIIRQSIKMVNYYEKF